MDAWQEAHRDKDGICDSGHSTDWLKHHLGKLLERLEQRVTLEHFRETSRPAGPLCSKCGQGVPE